MDTAVLYSMLGTVFSSDRIQILPVLNSGFSSNKVICDDNKRVTKKNTHTRVRNYKDNHFENALASSSGTIFSLVWFVLDHTVNSHTSKLMNVLFHSTLKSI